MEVQISSPEPKTPAPLRGAEMLHVTSIHFFWKALNVAENLPLFFPQLDLCVCTTTGLSPQQTAMYTWIS